MDYDCNKSIFSSVVSAGTKHKIVSLDVVGRVEYFAMYFLTDKMAVILLFTCTIFTTSNWN